MRSRQDHNVDTGNVSKCLYSIEKNKDVCIENLHYLNDGLWNLSL